MKKVAVILFVFIANVCFSHKYYVSITELEYDAEQNRIEGALKMSAHDFEHVLEDKFEKHIELEKVDDDSEIGKYMQLYLSQHFKLYSGDVQSKPTYLGKEITVTQDLYLYFTFSNIVKPSSIKVINTLLFELFTAQQNIVHYKYKDQTKSVTLVPSKTMETISFN